MIESRISGLRSITNDACKNMLKVLNRILKKYDMFQKLRNCIFKKFIFSWHILSTCVGQCLPEAKGSIQVHKCYHVH